MWTGEGISRRGLLRGAGATVVLSGLAPAARAGAQAAGPIVKPLPPELFDVFGSNAEMRWEAMRGQGILTPIDRFFVRDHTATPRIDAKTWRLKVFGDGLNGKPSRDNAIELTYDDVTSLPAHSVVAFLECAGNGRSFFGTQQNTPAPGTQWRLGAVGVARWRGVRLATVLNRAGITSDATDVMPQGLDAEVLSNGVNLGHVRRPIPVSKALDDVLLAYEMNGEPLPPDHGFPVRVIVPHWVGIASIKWVGEIEVAARPLSSPFNTQLYRLFGPEYPQEGTPITSQVTKSAFELPWQGATLQAGRTHVLRGRSWSGRGRIRHVRVSTDGGQTWRHAIPRKQHGWLMWELPWRPQSPGTYQLVAQATDETGAAQPATTPFNTNGYLYGALVRHTVTVV